MLNPTGLSHGHYECRPLDETLPVLTDLLAMERRRLLACDLDCNWWEVSPAPC